MNEHDTRIAMFTIGIFAMGAVAVILYQHAAHTKAIVGAIGSNTAPQLAQQGSADMLASSPASLAGTPSPFVDTQVSATPLRTGGNWSIG